ncbi:hypothetical protein BDY17DRAFT_36036 [Neohortaea acidophila]|uniref:Uncharacterized protein n=1 Tax=Neohortaea acidophila TaxID=245834 RepID=A0A6A6PLH4_9PEZI|nr:uncharacterized protein BDY17DRAFT_36036 [Neohortaea acidophila]KAF2480323.1 hypothetical protein BDY17DRAFT_36036 [Neohortaea acidophila]
MGREQSNSGEEEEEEDNGHHSSEQIDLQRSSKSTYLLTAMSSSDSEYDDVLEMMEREKMGIDNASSGYMHALDMSVHSKLYDRYDHVTSKSDVKYKHHSNNLPNKSSDKARVDSLLSASDKLVQTHRKADAAVRDAANATNDAAASPTTAKGSKGESASAALEANIAKDKSRVKGILAAGMRLFGWGAETSAVAPAAANGDKTSKATTTKAANGGKAGAAGAEAEDADEIATQTQAVFDGQSSTKKDLDAADAKVELALKYAERGVKKLGKGADSGA